MNVSIYIYIYIYIYIIERNIMKTQSSSLNFRIQGKISVYVCFIFSPLFFCFKNSFAVNFYTGLKPIV